MTRLFFGTVLLLGTVPMTARAQCSPNAPQIVDIVYRQVLERPADPASVSFAQALGSGRMTVRDVVAAVARSNEHRVRFYLRPIVVTVYRQMMDRDPSPDEMQLATSELAGGGDSLDEFVAHTATRAVNNRPDAVRLLYLRLLGREPDPEGLRNYTEAAQRQGIEAVARSLVRSDEYRVRTEDKTAMFEPSVRVLFRHLLGRDPDDFTLQQSMQLAAVYGVNGVVDRVMASQEYMQRYGDDIVPGHPDARFCGALNADRTATPRDPRSAIQRRR